MVIGTDGIPVEKLMMVPTRQEAVAAELTTLLRAGLAAAEDTGLGALQELSVSSERMTTLLRRSRRSTSCSPRSPPGRCSAGRASPCGWRALALLSEFR